MPALARDPAIDVVHSNAVKQHEPSDFTSIDVAVETRSRQFFDGHTR